jgi:glycerol 3-phosphatase-2
VLRTSAGPLTSAYDLAMFDLDGVVYVGEAAVSGAPEAISTAREAGMHIAFVTNSAARPPEVVAAHLTGLGVTASPDDVVTSAQAAAHLVRQRFGSGAKALLVGGPGLEEALLAEGLVPTTELGPDVVVVCTGYGPDLPWGRIMQGAVLINGGTPWVASNTDRTIPTSFGIGPGHGVLVRMLTDFTGVVPTVAGKPERALLDETVRRVGGQRPLMIGDRLDTDIEGADNAGLDSLLVLTGVTGLAELVAADAHHRPTYLAPDLAGLLTTHTAPQHADGGEHSLGGWRGTVEGGALRVAGDGDPADWWRVVAATAWEHRDRSGVVPSVTDLVPPPGSGHVGR